jgi:hypothetical protein
VVGIHPSECLVELVLRNTPVSIKIQLAVLERSESLGANISCFVGAAAIAVAYVAGFSRAVFVGVNGPF